MALRDIQCTVTGDDAGRIDLVVRTLTGRPRADVRGLFAHDCVQLNDADCSEPGAIVSPGDVVRVRHDPHRRYHAPPPDHGHASFRLIFEDAHLLVIDKAANVLTVPTDRRERHTLADLLTQRLRRKNPRARAGVVHRLDFGTSGLLVFGKTSTATAALREQFRIRKVEREYVAIVAGRPHEAEGTFTSRLGTTRSLHRRSVREDEPGETAVTHYRVIEELQGAAIVAVRLETGRRNQIRVHFAEAGHPVLGDDRYEPELARHSAWKARRLALHARLLAFAHPVTAAPLRFESAWPPEFDWFRARTRRSGS